MSCVNPSYIRMSLCESTGEVVYTFKGNARYLTAADFEYDICKDGFQNILVPCRHCLGCHIDYSRQWANRLCLELDSNPAAIFVTLTYDPKSLPLTSDGVPTLCKRDTQLFFKRLRKAFPDKRIRYYLAGEYGSRTHRPHYHAIIFGLSLLDFPDLKLKQYNELRQPLFISDQFASIWSNGFCLLAEVNYQTCAYCARYVLKKHYGANLEDLDGAEPEFNTSSRRPGIGLAEYQKILTKESDYITYRTSDGVHTIPIPKAIVRRGIDNEFSLDRCMEYKYNRLEASNSKIKSDLQFSEHSFDAYLKANYKTLRDRIKLLEERK